MLEVVRKGQLGERDKLSEVEDRGMRRASGGLSRARGPSMPRSATSSRRRTSSGQCWRPMSARHAERR